MPTSPILNAKGSLRFTVRSNGAPIASDYHLASFFIEKQVNRIGKAALTFKASVNEASEIMEVDSDAFLPGADVSVSGGYGEDEDVLFEGKVLAVQLSVNDYEGFLFTVECRDCAYPMTQFRSDAVYEKLSDTDIIQQVLGQYPGITAAVSASSAEHERMVQYQRSDWDFLLDRANAAGAVVVTEGAKVAVTAPKLSQAPALKVTYGVDMLSFRAELSAAHQPQAVETRAWDPNTQSLATSNTADVALNDQGNVTVDTLAQAIKADTRIIHAVTPDKELLDKMATAEKLRAGLARIRGTCTFPGSGLAKVGELIELVGVGSRFNGHAYIGGVTHDFDDTGWTTAVSLGLPQEDSAAGAPGSMRSGGLHIGVVVQIHEDPLKQNRIAIELPMLSQPGQQIWGRMASPWASDAYGMLSVPDVGDEVVVGFQQSNPSEPIILGSLYSSKRMPERAWDAENQWHGLQTKSGIAIGLDDKDKAIQIKTPGGINIEANDAEKSLSLQDMNGNELRFSADGIVMKSDKGIQIKSDGDIQIDTSMKLNQKGAMGTAIAGQNVEIKADVAATVKGTASAELSASGQTTVKGAMVMIN